jgi:hypothetical protein
MSVNDAASTLVALTFESATRSAQAHPPTLTPPATATAASPRLFVSADTKCRSGLTSNSKVLAVLTAGTTADMVGRNSAYGAWLVSLPNSAVTCWVAALASSPGGDFQHLPEATSEAVTLQLPAAPVELSWPFFCSYKAGVLYEITIDLSWMDTANDANGFRVYRQGTMIAELPAGVMSYTDKADVVIGTELTYSVEAFNEAGASPRLSHTFDSVCKLPATPRP